MRFILAFVAFVQASVAIANAEALLPSSDPIYVVDIQRVVNESVIGKAARSNIETEINKKRSVLEKIKLEGDKLKEEIQKQSTLLSAEALRAKQDLYEKKQRELERSYEDQREEIAQKNSEAMGKVIKQINDAVKKIADQNNYKLVIEKDLRVVVFVNDKYDISSEVIKFIDNEKIGL